MKQNKKVMYLEKYTISGLWMTMCGYIVLLFVKELFSGHYLISFSIDILVAVFAFYITLHHIVKQYQILNELQMKKKCFMIQIVGLLLGLLIACITYQSPFDVSFLILVIAFITNKKKFEKDIP